ncbi:hypothetical protein [Streptomyces lydicus]|uniref:Uncharacterized protein n=1 Tax=Streptomyces lydicus TaxID=47763 RepID=A0A1D7VI72_9ACTN|nr:hypothetical protein [Streptomyces lydicus]AOP46228.1 hypothetical protein SL103_08260 [Streptomyces lydicus]
MTLLSPSDDDMPSLIQTYNSMDLYLRSEFLDAIGKTREGWRSMVAAHERQRRAIGEQRASANAEQTEGSSASERDRSESSDRKAVVIAIRLARARKRIDFLLDAGEGNGNARSGRYRSAPPPRGFAATGPGRRRSGGGRRSGFRGRPDVPLIRIVIMLSEE